MQQRQKNSDEIEDLAVEDSAVALRAAHDKSYDESIQKEIHTKAQAEAAKASEDYQVTFQMQKERASQHANKKERIEQMTKQEGMLHVAAAEADTKVEKQAAEEKDAQRMASLTHKAAVKAAKDLKATEEAAAYEATISEAATGESQWATGAAFSALYKKGQSDKALQDITAQSQGAPAVSAADAASEADASEASDDDADDGEYGDEDEADDQQEQQEQQEEQQQEQ
jgi:hypothetical protein